MSRRWTGWVLTAAAIAAGPAPALSSNDPSNPYRHDLPQTVMPADSRQPSAVAQDGIYTDCLEVNPPRAALAVRSDTITVLREPYPGSKANGDLRFDTSLPADIDPSLRSAIEQSKGAGAAIPEGSARPARVRAACGIPRGVTLLAPATGSTAAAM